MKPKLRFMEFNSDWNKTTLKNIAIINPKNETLPDKFIYIDLESVNKGILSQEKIISKSDAPSRAQRTIKKNDILFQTVRPYQQNNYFVKEINDLPYVASTGYALIRTKENPYFIYSLLHKKEFLDKVIDRCTGTSFPAISSNDLADININIPDIQEQTKVSNFLSLLDKKIELQSKKIEDLKLFTKKIFNETIKGKEYHEYRIEELFKVSAGGDIKKENVSLVKNDIYCYPIFSNNLENDGLYGYSNLYKIDKDSITVTGRGDIGKALCRKQNYYPIVRLLVLIPKMELNLKFYQECINNLHIVKESTGVPQLTAPQISNYKVIYPSIDFQNKIGKTIELNEKKIDLELSKLNNLLRLKKWLMQNMFV